MSATWGGAREGSGRKPYPVEEVWLPAQEKRRCPECHCYLRQTNPGPFCSVCERVDIAKADAKRVRQMEPTSRTIPSARMNVAPRPRVEHIDLQLKAYRESAE